LGRNPRKARTFRKGRKTEIHDLSERYRKGGLRSKITLKKRGPRRSNTRVTGLKTQDLTVGNKQRRGKLKRVLRGGLGRLKEISGKKKVGGKLILINYLPRQSERRGMGSRMGGKKEERKCKTRCLGEFGKIVLRRRGPGSEGGPLERKRGRGFSKGKKKTHGDNQSNSRVTEPKNQKRKEENSFQTGENFILGVPGGGGRSSIHGGWMDIRKG